MFFYAEYLLMTFNILKYMKVAKPKSYNNHLLNELRYKNWQKSTLIQIWYSTLCIPSNQCFNTKRQRKEKLPMKNDVVSCKATCDTEQARLIYSALHRNNLIISDEVPRIHIPQTTLRPDCIMNSTYQTPVVSLAPSPQPACIFLLPWKKKYWWKKCQNSALVKKRLLFPSVKVC